MELEIDKGWIAALKLPSLLGKRVEVVIDYDNHMCCQLYLDTGHGFTACPGYEAPRHKSPPPR